LVRAPITPVQGVAAAQANRRCDQITPAKAHHGQNLAWHRFAKVRKERFGQRRMIAMRIEGRQIELVQLVPIIRGELIAVTDFASDACSRYLSAFLSDVFTLL